MNTYNTAQKYPDTYLFFYKIFYRWFDYKIIDKRIYYNLLLDIFFMIVININNINITFIQYDMFKFIVKNI